jgi:DNA-binding winged helix-turn-helix (wHTH) protein/TolB-like protein
LVPQCYLPPRNILSSSGILFVPSDSPTLFRLADLTLDLARGRLLRGTEDVALRPKSFALLSYMARHAGRVVSKDELLSAIWPGVTVTEDSLTQCVHEVRQALGPEGAALLRTVPRRGYLFAEGMAGGEGQLALPAAIPAEPRTDSADGTAGDAAPRLRRDGIAVLPFTLTSSANPTDALLLDGLAHDVISRLARLRGFHVIARGSAFALRHLAADPQAAGRALNVAYAVAGTAAMTDARVRLRIEIIDVAGGGILWTGDFSEDRAALTDLIGGLTDRIVHSVHMQVTAAETQRARAMPVEGLDAWETFHSGLVDAYWFDPERIGRALERFRLATRRDPGFARAYAAQSFCHYFMAFSGFANNREDAIAAARRTAEDALEADDANPTSHWAFGRALWLEGDAEGSRGYAKRAVALSPGFALGHYMVGFLETHSGDATRAIEHLDHVLSLSPFDPFLASTQITRAIALVRLSRLDEAAVWAQDAGRQPSAYSSILASASLVLACSGHIGEALQVAARLRATAPGFGFDQLNRSLNRMSDDVARLFRRNASLIGL